MQLLVVGYLSPKTSPEPTIKVSHRISIEFSDILSPAGPTGNDKALLIREMRFYAAVSRGRLPQGLGYSQKTQRPSHHDKEHRLALLDGQQTWVSFTTSSADLTITSHMPPLTALRVSCRRGYSSSSSQTPRQCPTSYPPCSHKIDLMNAFCM